jgi:hypothetical protein
VFLLVGLWPPRLQSLFAYLLLSSLAQLALLVVLTLLALTAKVLLSWVASGMVKERGREAGGLRSTVAGMKSTTAKEEKEVFKSWPPDNLC